MIVSRESSSRVHIFFMDPEGCQFQSAKDVECKLEADGTLSQFLKVDSNMSIVESEEY